MQSDRIKNMETMNAKEVCEALGISRPTLYARIREGVIKPLPKNPGHRRRAFLQFPRTEIEAYVQRERELVL